ncbi:MAG TPA: Fe-S-containing protein [Candidatus Eremiobacteraceae bacterium]|nr:Fe-S-containing protein [Candidatus Eremiobacteraceae bacterium]
MLSALLIALREGVEASLVVGIILVYLSRTARTHLARFVWYGVALAAALSLAVAIALEHWNVNQDGFEGLLLLVAAVFVVSMIFWMNRVARHLRKEIEQKIDTYAERAGAAAGWGIFLFVFLMVLREGVELALILRAVELSSDGLQTWIGTIFGLAAAIAVGLFFFKGTIKIPLHRFFSVTTIILWLVAAQLALTGLHEISEAQWIPSSKQEMAVIGPIVRNELFFFVFIFGAALLLILREWLTPSSQKTSDLNEAEQRLFEAQRRRQRRWMIAAATACLAVVLVLTTDFVYARANSAPPASHKIDATSGLIHIPLADLQDGNLHIFNVNSGPQDFRFIVIKKPQGWGVALDACRICGAEGYRQDGQNVVCRHCGSAIYVPTVGEAGGCNPVGLPFEVQGAEIVVNVSAITRAFTEVPK